MRKQLKNDTIKGKEQVIRNGRSTS